MRSQDESNSEKGHQVILLLGSNLGGRRRMLADAKEMIGRKAGSVVRESSLYETEPWGFESQHAFLNQVLALETHLEPQELMELLLEIEKELGRGSGSGPASVSGPGLDHNNSYPDKSGNNEPGGSNAGYSSRVIDIDILFYGQRIIDTPSLKVPHPQLHKRRFTLEPLSELYPNLVHPGFGKAISRLLDECHDHSQVHKIS
jgi:2-amino-4-hydroxy-6-hydroxymethyldihydropteridine diphosphokinase